jgi:hypothetical protein
MVVKGDEKAKAKKEKETNAAEKKKTTKNTH